MSGQSDHADRQSPNTQLISETEPEIRALLTESAGLLVCLDFDGTLSPISDSPDEPVITDVNYRLLRSLGRHPQVRVAVVSGRAITDLEPRVDIPEIVYAGNHGLEIARGDTIETHSEAARTVPPIQRASTLLRERLSSIPGATVENKRLTLTVHYRQVPPERRHDVERIVAEVPSRVKSPLRIVSGKQSFEIRPPVDWDKGNTVTLLADELPPDWRTVYIGDDTTDEDAFEALGPLDIGVTVGPEPSRASYRIQTQREVAHFLRLILATLGDGCPPQPSE